MLCGDARDDKNMEYWKEKNSENFTHLLVVCGEDKKLGSQLNGMFPENTGNAWLVISKEELRDYLYKELRFFFSLG